MVPYVQRRLHDVTSGLSRRAVSGRLPQAGFEVQSDRISLPSV
jgi:hypothetical protein